MLVSQVSHFGAAESHFVNECLILVLPSVTVSHFFGWVSRFNFASVTVSQLLNNVVLKFFGQKTLKLSLKDFSEMAIDLFIIVWSENLLQQTQ